MIWVDADSSGNVTGVYSGQQYAGQKQMSEAAPQVLAFLANQPTPANSSLLSIVNAIAAVPVIATGLGNRPPLHP